MDIRIEGRNLRIGPRLEAQVNRKFDQIERHLPAATAATVELLSAPARSQQERFLANVRLNVKGSIIRAEGRGPTAVSAVSAAVVRLDQMAARFKGQVYRSQRTRSYVSLAEQQAEELIAEDIELARQFQPGEESEIALTL